VSDSMRSGRSTLPLAGVMVTLYVTLLRRRILTWGATEWEASSRLPGDELLEDGDGVATRAIDIHAPVRGLALARADGPVAARWRLHV
jgi:hypothetical protein